MGYLLFILFLLLAFSLIFSLARRRKWRKYSLFFRSFSVIFGFVLLGYWFFEKSSLNFVKDSLSVQIINKLPQPLDFYIVKIGGKDNPDAKLLKHPGKIRPEYYRIEYLKMDYSNEFWVVGFLGKENLVYFSQHFVPNKNIDQIIEAKNYTVENEKLASEAKKIIENYRFSDMNLGIWTTLNLLLLFLNLVLLLRKNILSKNSDR